MPNIPWKLIGGLAVVLIIIACVLWVRGYVRRAEADHASAARYAQCETAVAAPVIDPKALALCGENIAMARVAQVQANRCDDALAKGLDGLAGDKALVGFGIEQTCSTPIKTLVANRNARAGEATGHLAEIGRLRASRAGDIARAENRAGLIKRRHDDAAVAKQMAPVGSDGLREYRGDSLRRLGGEAPVGSVAGARPAG